MQEERWWGMSKKAMKLALEALEKLMRFESDSWELGSCRVAGQAIKALREALAEQPSQYQCKFPMCHNEEYQQALAEQIMRELYTGQPAQQEPVAWMKRTSLLGDDWDAYDFSANPYGEFQTPLYTSPPASKPWVGLTDEEIDVLVMDSDGLPKSHLEFARAIEAKLKEKNA